MRLGYISFLLCCIWHHIYSSRDLLLWAKSISLPWGQKFVPVWRQALIHFLNQSWFSINRTLRNIILWNVKIQKKIFMSKKSNLSLSRLYDTDTGLIFVLSVASLPGTEPVSVSNSNNVANSPSAFIYACAIVTFGYPPNYIMDEKVSNRGGFENQFVLLFVFEYTNICVCVWKQIKIVCLYLYLIDIFGRILKLF